MQCRGFSLQALIKQLLKDSGAAAVIKVAGISMTDDTLQQQLLAGQPPPCQAEQSLSCQAGQPPSCHPEFAVGKAQDLVAAPNAASSAAPNAALDAERLLRSPQHDSGGASGSVRVAVLGNPALLYNEYLNRHIAQQIKAGGCVPVFPPLQLVLGSVAPLEDLLPWVVNSGIRDVLFVQSFGCLSSHIHGRGAMKQLKAAYPDCNITFIDYDPGASPINQENRIRLALAIAQG
jgi:hypothetical protein